MCNQEQNQQNVPLVNGGTPQLPQGYKFGDVGAVPTQPMFVQPAAQQQQQPQGYILGYAPPQGASMNPGAHLHQQPVSWQAPYSVKGVPVALAYNQEHYPYLQHHQQQHQQQQPLHQDGLIVPSANPYNHVYTHDIVPSAQMTPSAIPQFGQHGVQNQQDNLLRAYPAHHTPYHDYPEGVKVESKEQITEFEKHSTPLYAIATSNNPSTAAKRQKIMKHDGTSPIGQAQETVKVEGQLPVQEEQPNPKKAVRNSRRRHRNSHLGCATCKSRRIKCDEQLPECRNCVRARQTCAYLALDSAAREALKTAQQAQAARIQSLNLQASQREARKNPHLYYPYQHPGLPSRILMSSLPSTDNVFQLQVNLQQAVFPVYQPQVQQLQQAQFQLPQQQQPPQTLPPPLQAQQQASQQQILQEPSNSSVGPEAPQETQPKYEEPDQPRKSRASSVLKNRTIVARSPFVSDTGSATSASPMPSGSDRSKESSLSDASGSSREPQFAIRSDAYKSLVALLKEHKDSESSPDLDYLSRFDNDFMEIVLDQRCLSGLNTLWTDNVGELTKQELKFSTDALYKVFDMFQMQFIKEACNNIVLFKALIAQGSAHIADKTQNEDVRKAVQRVLEKDFEITLRFLNRFRVHFTMDYSDVDAFYNNVSVCFSKFQIFQMALPTIFHGNHSLNDVYQFISSFFQFSSGYLSHQFQVFLSGSVPINIQNDPVFKRASVLNDHLHLFIIYYVQSIRAYHTRAYSTEFMNEFLTKLNVARDDVYEQLNDKYKAHIDDLVTFTETCVKYWNAIKDGAETNRIQVMFYTLKRFLNIVPDEAFISHVPVFEEHLVHLYYQAAMYALKAIYADCTFLFLYSFNARDGCSNTDMLVEASKSDLFTEEQREKMNYPTKLMSFFKERGILISGYLKSVARFPAKIILDDTNKSIMMQLVKEDQVSSFEQELDDESYPHIDETSTFFHKETNSIVIPSVNSTDSFSNFEAAQIKRDELMKRSIETELTDIDKSVVDTFCNV